MKGKPLLALNLFWAALTIGAFLGGSMVTKSRLSPGKENETGNAAVPGKPGQVRAKPGEDSASPRLIIRRSPLPVPGERSTRVIVIRTSQDFAKLVKTDLEEAKRVFSSVEASPVDPHGITRQTYGSMIVAELLTRDLDQAISFSDREFIWYYPSVEKLAAEVGKQRGGDGLLKWIDNVKYRGEEVGELDYKKIAARTAMTILAGEDPEGARGWLIANAGQPHVDGSTLQRVATAVDEDPGFQLGWLSDLPISASDKSEGIAGVFAGYLRTDLDAAAQWLAEQELGPMHDLAIKELVNAASVFDREGARIWAEEISDEVMRIQTLERLGPLE